MCQPNSRQLGNGCRCVSDRTDMTAYQTPPPRYSPTPVHPPERPPRWAVSVAVVGVVSLLLLVVWAASAASFTMNGTFTDDSVCGGYGPRSVTVYNMAGNVIGAGSVSKGTPTYYDRCIYPFTVPDVPAGEDTYVIEISGEGQVAISDERAEAPTLFDRGYGG